jgi:hypothetical protein
VTLLFLSASFYLCGIPPAGEKLQQQGYGTDCLNIRDAYGYI